MPSSPLAPGRHGGPSTGVKATYATCTVRKTHSEGPPDWMKALTVSPVREMSICGSGVEINHLGPGDSADTDPQSVDNTASRPKEGENGDKPPCLKGRNHRLASPADLLTLLACRELSPRLLEHEKALLVIKEHDYARPPDRPLILQLASMYGREGEEARASEACPLEGTPAADNAQHAQARAETDDPDTNRHVSAEEVLLNCCSDVLRLRASLARRGGDGGEALASHLRDVVGLQVTLIREQQEQLHEKDGELKTVRKEKEQLEARLERMERRLAILQKHSRDRHAVNDTDTPSPSTPTLHASSLRSSRLALRLDAEQQRSHSRSSSTDQGRLHSRPSSHSGTPAPDDRSSSHSAKKAARKRVRCDPQQGKDVKRARRKSVQTNEVRTSLEYTGLDLPLPSGSTESLVAVCNHSGDDSEVPSVAESTDQPIIIEVPSWTEYSLQLTTLEEEEEAEDTSEDVFVKRHRKPEEDEKRRKRWDLQRLRQQREHDDLLRKYQLKAQGATTAKEKKKEEKIATFLPKLEEIEMIEVMNTVAVSAFGRPLPLLPSSDFELPWFDLDVREARETVRTTRSKARAAQMSAGSADEA